MPCKRHRSSRRPVALTPRFFRRATEPHRLSTDRDDHGPMAIVRYDIMIARLARGARRWLTRLLVVAATFAGANCACASGDLSDVSDLGPPEPAFSTDAQSARITQNGNGNAARVDQSGLNAVEVL